MQPVQPTSFRVHPSVLRAARAALSAGALDPLLHETLPWPWDGLEQRLIAVARREQACNSADVVTTADAMVRPPCLHLIGYGSLLNPESARVTIPGTPPGGHPPVLAFGARRIFNYVISNEAALRRYGALPVGRERAALNAERTGQVEDIINGRLLDVPLADLDALRQREFGYDLEPVIWRGWDDAVVQFGFEPAESAGHLQPGDDAGIANRETVQSSSAGETCSWSVGYVLCAPSVPPPMAVRTRQVVDDDLLPHPGYLETCRAGARMVSEDFERVFLMSTLLGDRSTRLSEHVCRMRE